MTIRFPASSGTDMKRVLILSLSLLLLLCGCSKPHGLEKTDDGYTDEKSGIHYVALDPSYQPAARGEVFAEYKNKDRDIVRAFYEIPQLGTDLFLCDEYWNVYYAGETAPDASLWQLKTILVCEEDGISVERSRLSAGADDAEIALVRVLWFGDTESVLLPITAPAYTFQIKLSGEEYPTLYYNFSMQIYENGEVYFYDAFSRRTVLLPEQLAVALCPADTLPEENG